MHPILIDCSKKFNDNDIRISSDPDLAGSYAAMQRAAFAAQELAIKTNSDITKCHYVRTVFVRAKHKAALQTCAGQATWVDRNYSFFASQKSIKLGFNANSLGQAFALIYEGAGLKGTSSHSCPRTFLMQLPTKAHSHSPIQDAGSATQHQHHRCLPLQQPQFAQGGGGASVII